MTAEDHTEQPTLPHINAGRSWAVEKAALDASAKSTYASPPEFPNDRTAARYYLRGIRIAYNITQQKLENMAGVVPRWCRCYEGGHNQNASERYADRIRIALVKLGVSRRDVATWFLLAGYAPKILRRIPITEEAAHPVFEAAMRELYNAGPEAQARVKTALTNDRHKRGWVAEDPEE